MIIYIWAHTTAGHKAGTVCDDPAWFDTPNAVLKFEGSAEEIKKEVLPRFKYAKPLSTLGMRIAENVHKEVNRLEKLDRSTHTRKGGE
jgi:hypothetical protein